MGLTIMCNTTPLYSYFHNYFVDGAIFSKMPMAPWMQVGTGLEMDIAYLASYSGIKPTAYFIRQFLDTQGNLNQQKLADVLWSLYGKNWERLWDAFNSKYDPLNNYDVSENIDRDTSIDRDINKDIKESVNSDVTDKLDSTSTVDQTGKTVISGTDTTEYGKKVDTTSTTQNYTHGYNSTSSVPTSVSNSTSNEVQSGTDKVISNQTSDMTNHSVTTVDSNDKVISNSSSTTTDVTSDDQTEQEKIVRTRKGNIGQNTYQELLRQEFELWKWNFYNQVFSDCDKLLVLSVYSDCC